MKMFFLQTQVFYNGKQMLLEIWILFGARR